MGVRVETLRRAAAVAVGAGLLLAAGVAWGGAGGAGVDPAGMLRLIGGLLVVVLVIVGLSWSLRRFGGFTSVGAGQLRSLASLPVGARERVVLVQVGKQQLLLGVAPGRVQTLHVLEEPIETTDVRAAREQAGSFADRLRRAMRQQGEQR